MSVSNVENLTVFKKSHQLTLALYNLTKQFPSDEKFGLISQIRRASSSICANLMEGSHRNNSGEYRQFVGISRGSTGELKYHILLAKDLGYITSQEYLNQMKEINDISKMLHGLINSLTNKPNTHSHTKHTLNHSKGISCK